MHIRSNRKSRGEPLLFLIVHEVFSFRVSSKEVWKEHSGEPSGVFEGTSEIFSEDDAGTNCTNSVFGECWPGMSVQYGTKNRLRRFSREKQDGGDDYGGMGRKDQEQHEGKDKRKSFRGP